MTELPPPGLTAPFLPAAGGIRHWVRATHYDGETADGRVVAGPREHWRVEASVPWSYCAGEPSES